MFENKKVFILGMARSGYEIAKVLAKRNNIVVINDNSNDQNPDHVKELENLGVMVVLGSHPDDILTDDFDYMIKNPGIKNNHKYVEFCEKNNIEVINEVEATYRLLPEGVTIVGITGTNGKTTTTTLIYEILKRGSRTVHLTGNIGYPLASFLDKIKTNDIIVIEVSLQQLCNLKDFKTNISVLTNISEAHTDMVGTYENYKSMKKRIFNHHTKSDIAIINYENSESMNLTSNISSNKIYFSSKRICDGAYLLNDDIYYNNEKVISTKDIRLKGSHNYENIMCAIIVCFNLGINANDIFDVINDFGGVEHRLEFVRKLEGREFYNDSKATNNEATITALKSFNENVIILMGGLDRGLSFDELKPYLGCVKSVITYGETKDRIKAFMDTLNIDCTVTDNLERATILAYQMSNPGDTILLSPACASWDQYKCFEDRGTHFKSIVNELKGENNNE